MLYFCLSVCSSNRCGNVISICHLSTKFETPSFSCSKNTQEFKKSPAPLESTLLLLSAAMLRRSRRCRCSRAGWRHTCPAAATKLFDFEWHPFPVVIISPPDHDDDVGPIRYTRTNDADCAIALLQISYRYVSNQSQHSSLVHGATVKR